MTNGANGANVASWPALLIPPYRDGRFEQASADLVEDLRTKLRAAEGRERQLHQHLIFHLQEKEVLLNQVVELQRMCEGLLHAQAQGQSNGGGQEKLSAATSIGTSRSSATATGVLSPPHGELSSFSPIPPSQVSLAGVKDGQLPLSGGWGKSHGTGGSTDTGSPPHVSTSLEAIREPPGVSHSRNIEARASSALTLATGGGTVVPSPPVQAIGWSDGAPPVLEAPVGVTFVAALNEGAVDGCEQAKAMGAGQGRPATEIPQLLREKGGHIRIMELWECYQSRFGVTCYTLKDLFAMIKDGNIPGVVHEPPTGIRLVTPVERQQTQVLSPPPITPPPQQQQQQEQPKETQPSVLDAEWSSSSPGPAAGLPQISPPNVATGGGWEQGLKVDLPAKESGTRVTGEGKAESDGAGSRAESPESDVGGAGGSVKSYSEKAGGGNEGRSSAEREKEVVDWRNLQRNVNFLLKGEGPLSAREFNECYTKRFRKAPYLDGFTLRYAVTAGWIKGVCIDVRSKKYNLVMKVPERCREPPPDDAPTSPPDLHAQQPPRMTEARWTKVSEEFRVLLTEGMLDPNELNAQYRKKFKKQLALPGFTIRSAVSEGHLEGVTIDNDTLRLKLA